MPDDGFEEDKSRRGEKEQLRAWMHMHLFQKLLNRAGRIDFYKSTKQSLPIQFGSMLVHYQHHFQPSNLRPMTHEDLPNNAAFNHRQSAVTSLCISQGKVKNFANSLGKSGVPKPVTGSHPLVAVNPGVPHP